jgi:hypothetical protein
LIYGSEGRGKTTLATKFPKPVAMLLERGLPRGVKIDAIDGITSFEHVMGAIRDLYSESDGLPDVDCRHGGRARTDAT